MKRLKLPGLGTQFAIAFVAVTGVGIMAYGWYSARLAENFLRWELGEKLLTFARLASADEKVRALPYATRTGAAGGAIVAAARERLGSYVRDMGIGNLIVTDRDSRVIADARGAFRFGDRSYLLRLDAAELGKVWNGQLAYSQVYEGEDGKLYLSAYAPLAVGPDIRLAVGAEASAEFLQRIRYLRKRLYQIGATVLALAVLFGLLTARTITRPLRQLTVAAQRLERGDHDATASVSAGAEVGELARAFNRMARMINVRRELLLENMSNGVVAVDQHGVVTEVNRAAEALLGVRRDVLLGASFRGRLPAELAQALDETLAGDEPLKGEKFDIRPADGETRILQVSTSALRDADGSLVGAELSSLDVTELERLTGALESQRRFAMIGEMAAEVAHQIRNPLAAIQGFADLLKSQLNGDVKSREYLEDLLKEVRATEGIVSSFLAFSKPSRLDLRQVDPAEVVSGTCRAMRPEFAASDIVLSEAIRPPLPVLHADAKSVTQALTNLIRNALEACGRGGRVAVVAESTAEPSGVLIAVEDDGAGLDPAIRPRLFTPFVTTKARGTGLGLSLARKYIEAHGGTVTLEPMARGTRAEIRLPAVPFAAGVA